MAKYFSDEEIYEKCNEYNFTEEMKEHLSAFLQSRARFHADETTQRSAQMKHDYELLYTDLKIASHCGIISEADFFSLVNVLKFY